MDGQMNGRTHRFPLCSIGLRPLRVRYPKRRKGRETIKAKREGKTQGKGGETVKAKGEGDREGIETREKRIMEAKPKVDRNTPCTGGARHRLKGRKETIRAKGRATFKGEGNRND